ncbi:apolipoprotein N-acyltransferase [Microbacterium sp. ZXX196]|nr:apolipoprotein N-acyltransferase [Microbacterium sp. ZXX196]
MSPMRTDRVADPSARGLPLWAAALAAAAGGFALDLSFPSAGVWPLAFVAVALSLSSLVGRTYGSAFLVGALFGAAFYFPHIDWAARFLGDNPLAWVPWAALAGIETVFMALGALAIAATYRWLPRVTAPGTLRPILTALLVAGVWTAREIVMGSWPYGGFPWGRIGMSQSESPLAPVASWISVSGLSFLIVLLAAALVEAVRVALQRDPRAPRSWSGLAIPALGGVALALVPAFPTTAAGEMSIAAVQGNGPAAYLDARGPYDVLDAQIAATAPVVGQDVDLVVWPEGGVDADPLRDPAAAAQLDAQVAALGAPLLVNAAIDEGDLVYNRSLLWTADGPAAEHSKRYPVPFGEYVPQRDLYERLAPSLVAMIGREYTPGTDAPNMVVDGVGIGLAICFDVLFDDLVFESIDGGAQVLAFQTNNADFRGTEENVQQLAVARMRAIETGRSVVNVSTVGTSQVIAPDGTAIASLAADEAGAIVADVELRDGTTPAVAAGGGIRAVLTWFPLAGLAIAGALADRLRRMGAGAEPGA